MNTKSISLLFIFLLTFTMNEPLIARLPKGIAGGNPTVSNEDFDFNMKRIGTWIDESENHGFANKQIGASDLPVDHWYFHNKESQESNSWLNIDFIAGFPVESLQELGDYVQRKFPDLEWSNFQETNMLGYRSKEILDSSDPNGFATTGRLIYFMDRKMLVSVSWRRHPKNGGSTDVSTMLATMDRYTAPPNIKSINIDSPQPVKPSDRLCYQIRVDDLKSSFTNKGLKDFNVSGIPAFWIWSDVIWNEELGAFQICLKLPKKITNNLELLVETFRIENERGRTVQCNLQFVTLPPELLCQSNYKITMSPPEVLNNSPDLSPPKISNLTFDTSEQKYTLHGHADEESEISGGWLLVKQILGDETKIFLAPWQFKDGNFSLSLDAAAGNGTRRISEIILSDINGNTSRLMPCDYAKSTNVSKSFDCQAQNYVHCTTVNSNVQKCNGTDIPVIEYFSKYRQ